MNCPQCNQPIGDDQYGCGPWRDFAHDFGRLRGQHRVVAIICSHCGVFEMTEQALFEYRGLRGPFTNDKDLRRLEPLIPALRRDRRVPA